jgi:hypothetical protein
MDELEMLEGMVDARNTNLMEGVSKLVDTDDSLGMAALENRWRWPACLFRVGWHESRIDGPGLLEHVARPRPHARVQIELT